MSIPPVLLVNLVLVWLAIGVLYFLVVGLARRQHRSVDRPPDDRFARMLKPGALAPRFAAHLLSGRPVTSESFAGNNVAYIFFGTHCDPCKKKLPELEATRDRAASIGLEMVIVSTSDEEETEQFFLDNPASLKVLVAPRSTNSFMTDYGVPGTPSYVVVSASGAVVDSNVMTTDVPTLLSGWEKLLVARSASDRVVTT